MCLHVLSGRVDSGYFQAFKPSSLQTIQSFRLLREALEDGPKVFTPAGNLNGVGLNYVFRYGKLKEMTEENDELAPAFEGDDF